MTAAKPVPMARPQAAPWELETDVDVLAWFPAESINVTVAVTFRAGIMGLVPDTDYGSFWDAFWDGFADRIEDTLAAGLGTGSLASLETARQTAARLLAARFAEQQRTVA